MIYCLTGKLLEKAPDYAVVSCGGVGYLAAIPSTTAGALPAVGDTCTLYTCMNVTENDVSLFGFADKESQTMFRLLTGVSGVGPKVGLAILSVLSPDRVVLAISAGDHKAFTAASGVGPKLGQRIVLELKDKVGMFAEITLKPGCSLGYHVHSDNAEAYYILSGEGEYDDNGEIRTVKPGDVTYTSDGKGHSLENKSQNDLVFIALIINN